MSPLGSPIYRKSGLAFVDIINPNFDCQRVALLAKLRAIPGVDWLKPAVFSEEYFHLDEGAPSPS